MTKVIIALFAGLLFIGCKSEQRNGLHKSEIIIETYHSGEPNLFLSSENELYLSWVEYENDSTDVLLFSRLDQSSWSKPKEVARGNDWFVNWADFPSLVYVKNNSMSAHWLQKSANGTYDYDVKISQSNDGGNTWSSPIIPHRDGVNAEHGFVSMLPTPEDNTFAVWLDGRNTKSVSNNAMTLRTAEIDKEGNLMEERELDNSVCDCCQTGATWSDQGPIVVYRDRSKGEVRDISIVRKVNGKWTKPKSVFEDNWVITGCPVNGPAIDSEGNKVVVVWYTMRNDMPKVFATISNDFGATFGQPIRMDEGFALGRVDVEIVDGKVYVMWMENQNEWAEIMMKTITGDDQVSDNYILGINSPVRASGFPRMSVSKDGIIVAWTDTRDSIQKVRSFRIDLL